MSYKKLGNYIQQVNNRNRDLQVDTLLGVSITKKLIPSIANTVGTDMSTYKIIEKGQFAYGTITSRNGDKISIALADEYDKALVSQIYIVFEVIDTNELLPEYLMMWFSRPEFDRYARYHSHGSTRESFDWEDMCNVELPVPSIEKQREIVAQYQAVENKIKVNEQICEKLEATAQTLYKQWFNKDLGECILVESLFIPRKGKNITRENAILGEFPVVAGGLEPSCYHNEYNTNTPVITISASGANAGFTRLYQSKVWAADCSFIDLSIYEYVYFAYVALKVNQDLLMSKQEGTGQPHIYPEHIVSIPIFNYSEEMASKYNSIFEKDFNLIRVLNSQNQKLTQLQSLLLSRLATLEG
ncbi:Type I restriction modification DNA specificity domain [Candidatus Ornithobacterium hominis]|uniref:restriction endonuclease subunit S n=1 Tax=Candidatus Ornithobacterium hominis TaxID=2497989 RepID=UPI000E5BF116|nr:restriction endonuclease subunit S [Candidatus Ornithobacterium hominis]SZD73051.1 Type I restriction modification DNA specificity domain [Candidatus Ornithobacterium hominis]